MKASEGHAPANHRVSAHVDHEGDEEGMAAPREIPAGAGRLLSLRRRRGFESSCHVAGHGLQLDPELLRGVRPRDGVLQLPKCSDKRFVLRASEVTRQGGVPPRVGRLEGSVARHSVQASRPTMRSAPTNPATRDEGPAATTSRAGGVRNRYRRPRPEGLEGVERFGHAAPTIGSGTRSHRGREGPLRPAARMTELLLVPELRIPAAEVPPVVVALVGVEVDHGEIEPVFRFEHVVVGPAVDHAMGAVVAVEVDDVISDHVHGAMERPEDVVVEDLHPLTPSAVPPVVDVFDEEHRDGLEVLRVDRHSVAGRELVDLVAGYQFLQRVHDVPLLHSPDGEAQPDGIRDPGDRAPALPTPQSAHCGSRFSMKARGPSLKSGWVWCKRLNAQPYSLASVWLVSSEFQMLCMVSDTARGEFAAIAPAISSTVRAKSLAGTTSSTSPI